MKLSPKLNLPIPEGSDIHNLTNFVALLNAIDNSAAPLGTMNNHIDNKNNPHAVTKAQVGLGQVNNVPQYSKTEMDSKLAELSKTSQLPADSVPSTGTPASFPIGITAMTVTSGDYPGVTTNSPGTLMTVRGSNDRGTYQLLSGNGTPQQRAYDGAAWGGWSTVATTASNVASASKLANARKIGGVNFDGTSDITLPGVNAPGNQPTSGKAATAGRAETAGTADVAVRLNTPRKIGGVAFDGTKDINLPGVNSEGNQNTSGLADGAKWATQLLLPTYSMGGTQSLMNTLNSMASDNNDYDVRWGYDSPNSVNTNALWFRLPASYNDGGIWKLTLSSSSVDNNDMSTTIKLEFTSRLTGRTFGSVMVRSRSNTTQSGYYEITDSNYRKPNGYNIPTADSVQAVVQGNLLIVRFDNYTFDSTTTISFGSNDIRALSDNNRDTPFAGYGHDINGAGIISTANGTKVVPVTISVGGWDNTGGVTIPKALDQMAADVISSTTAGFYGTVTIPLYKFDGEVLS